MTNSDLATSYIIKATKRLKILDVLFEEEDYSDVIREAQEIVELALKGVLRYVGIDVPKIHDVGDILKKFRNRFSPYFRKNIDKMAKISRYLRKERELSFYGDIDFIPSEEYTQEDAKKAKKSASWIVKIVRKEIRP